MTPTTAASGRQRRTTSGAVLRGWFLAALVVSVTAVVVGERPAAAETTVGDVNAASTQLAAEVDRYLAFGSRQSQARSVDWERFFANGERRLTTVERSFTRWSRLLDRAIADGNRPSGYRRLVRFRDALEVWVGDQREQLTLSRGCFQDSAASQSEDAVADCYQRLVQENGPRWLQHVTTVKSLLPRR